MNVGFCRDDPAAGVGLELLEEFNPQSPPGQFVQFGAQQGAHEEQGEQHAGAE